MAELRPIAFLPGAGDVGAEEELRALGAAIGSAAVVVEPGAAPPDGHVLVGADPADLLPWRSGAAALVLRIAPWGGGALADVLAAFGALDRFWVPTERGRSALVAAGVDAARVGVVPVAVDVASFAPGAAPVPLGETRAVRLLTVVDWARRGGWDALVRAYVEEFTTDDDVTLVLKPRLTAIGQREGEVAVDVELLLAELEVDEGALPDLLVQPAEVPADALPGLYAAASAFVLPARGVGYGRGLLEAMASGLPVVATPSGPVAPDRAVVVGGEEVELPGAGAREAPWTRGATWLEPDVAALRRALRDVVTGAVDRDALGAAARAWVTEHHARERVAAAALEDLAGLVTASPRAPGPPPSREGAHPEEVSFVVQGPVGRGGPADTARVCASIRAHFPGAEIVLSTWRDQDVSGVDADEVVRSDDPGVVGPLKSNVNRQIVSSLAGLQAASRRLAVKTRTDLVFRTDALLGFWGRWPVPDHPLRIFDERVLLPNVIAQRPLHVSPYPLHPTDWAFLGLRSDLLRLFGIPLMREEQGAVPAERRGVPRLFWNPEITPQYVPEQFLWVGALRRAVPDLELAHPYELTSRTVELTEASFGVNLAILDTPTQFGIEHPKYPQLNRAFVSPQVFQHEQWLELHDLHALGHVDPSAADAALDALRARDRNPRWSDARDLRRAGRPWEAQLVESILMAPLRRDWFTGGMQQERDEIAAFFAQKALMRITRA